MHLIDRDTIADLKKGNLSAFNRVYEVLSNGVYSVCFKITKDKHVAEDILQDVFVKLWNYRGQLDVEGNIWVFLYVVSKQLSINKIKAIQRSVVQDEEAVDLSQTAPSPEEEVFYKELKSLMDKTIAELPHQQRTVIELSRNEGLTHQQIALRLGIAPNTVKNHMTQALKKLRTHFGDAYFHNTVPLMAYFEIFFHKH
ncbi:RNA polymerase sigma factor [Sphingobacterium tabacisoli]|uniref:RNA polymerase sigma factor n=1 Tax=Sphingobacterium tabacisoli TaxID=2044855 RepID=A0ABW5KZA3_9SPHI|nr:RNA polymerase sigma-70 factor [Sphingobacterium tabacisoli]